MAFTIKVNKNTHSVDVASGTPLLWVLRDTMKAVLVWKPTVTHEAGRLVPLLEDWWTSPAEIFLYYSSRRQVPARCGLSLSSCARTCRRLEGNVGMGGSCAPYGCIGAAFLRGMPTDGQNGPTAPPEGDPAAGDRQKD